MPDESRTAEPPTTSEECVRQAWAALLRDDTAERDRLVKRAERLLVAEQRAAAVERVLSVDFYVTRTGRVIPTKMMARASRAIQ